MGRMDVGVFLQQVEVIARQAGAAIMEVYDSADFNIELKDDKSPLTKADKLASEIIEVELLKIADYEVISEENNERSGRAERFWLVDPLDGTKEFIKRNGEFTVNIGLIENGRPVLGVVYAPVLDRLYAGVENEGAYVIEASAEPRPIRATFDGSVPVIVTSRSHKDERTQKLLDKIGEYEETSMGSSLKLCLIAEGKAELYPRLAPTYLWDTAAADAVVRSAGGTVKNELGQLLEYYPVKSLKNPYFIVAAENTKLNCQKLL